MSKAKCPFCGKLVEVTKKGGYSPHRLEKRTCIGSGAKVYPSKK